MISEAERVKYSQIWAMDRYAEVSPGLEFLDMFWSIATPQRGQRVLDIGAGNGAASVALHKRGLEVHAFDITEAFAECNVGEDNRRKDYIPFHVGCLWHGLPKGPFDFGYCTDVMEHIPTQFIGLVLSNILTSCRRTFFSISFQPDVNGAAIRQPLHLTVQPFVWWRDTLRELGTVYEARDIIGGGLFYVGR